jgi:hypothetical protein
MRDRFKALGRACARLNGVDQRDTFVDAVSNHGDVSKKVLYSLTHGGCVEGTGGQAGIHIYKALTMMSNWETLLVSGVPEKRRVYPNDLPEDLNYEFVLIVACHAGHEIANSNAAALRHKFSSQVYVAPKGGEKAGTPPCCLYYYNGRAFGEQYMESIVNNRATDTFQQAFDRVAERNRRFFIIRAGAAVKVKVVFP